MKRKSLMRRVLTVWVLLALLVGLYLLFKVVSERMIGHRDATRVQGTDKRGSDVKIIEKLQEERYKKAEEAGD